MRKAFHIIGAMGVWAAMDKTGLQHVVLECTKEKGDSIRARCTNPREFKQGMTTVMGASLSLE